MNYSLSKMISVDKQCNDPDGLWKKYLTEGRICNKVNPIRLFTPISKDFVRFVCISDTHERMADIMHRIPPGDILIHAGDITNWGSKNELNLFNNLIGALPHKYKVVIAGNHDFGLEDNENKDLRMEKYKGHGTYCGYQLLTNCIYLQDSEVQLYGIRIYGSSWHPLPGYSFSRKRGQELLDKWNLIPDGIDVLITHTPPLGHNDIFKVGDGDLKGERWGCSELLNTIEKRVRPKYHIFGHVHEQNGITTNNITTFINASICNHNLDPINYPIIFDLPLKEGISKDA